MRRAARQHRPQASLEPSSMPLEGIWLGTYKLGNNRRCQQRWTDARGGLVPFYTAPLIPRDCVQEGCLAAAEREEGPAPAPALPALLGDLGDVVICWG